MTTSKILEKQYMNWKYTFYPTKILCSNGETKHFSLNTYPLTDQTQDEKMPVQICIAQKMQDDNMEFNDAKTYCEAIHQSTLETEKQNIIQVTPMQQCETYMRKIGLTDADAKLSCRGRLTELWKNRDKKSYMYGPVGNELILNPLTVEVLEQTDEDRFVADYVSKYNLHPSVALRAYKKQIKVPVEA